MKTLSLILLAVVLSACATVPQPYWRAPERADLNQAQDDLECRALANQAATGAGAWSSDPQLRAAIYQQAAGNYYRQCLQSRGYALVTPR